MPKKEIKFKAIYMGLRLDSSNKLVESWYRYDTQGTLMFSKRRGTAPVIGISYPFIRSEDDKYSVPSISNFLRGEELVAVEDHVVAKWRDIERADKSCLDGLKYKPASDVREAMDTIKTALANKHYSQKHRFRSWILKELL